MNKEAIAKLLYWIKPPFCRQFSPCFLACPFGHVLVGTARASQLALRIGGKIIDFLRHSSFTITSKSIYSLLFFLFPLASVFAVDPSLPLTIEAGSVQYDSSTGILKGKWVVLFKDDQDKRNELTLRSENMTLNKNLLTLQSDGQTHLTYTEKKRNQAHDLICAGQLFIDHAKKKLTMNSGDKKQIYFQDYMGAIYSDKVVVDYEWTEGTFLPKTITLTGNVRIHNSFAREGQSQKPLDQYALADTVVYLPEKEMMTLTADPKRRVLFFDKVNHMQMSAPEILVTRNPQTKKEMIKGKGDVRLTFAGQELEQLYKEFHLN